MKPLALVVGAGGGIGRETAGLLCDHGYEVLAADRDAEGLSRLSREGIGTLLVDITDRSGVRDAVERLKAAGRPIRALVVTAAIHSTHPAEHLTDEVIDGVLDTNLASQIKLVRDLLPLMETGGSLVAVSSIAACVGVPMSSMYSASKRGLEGFYESLHAELLPRGIRVCIVQPGNVNTGFNETGNTYSPSGDSELDRRYRAVVSRIDSKYGIDPSRVAEVIVRILRKKGYPRFCTVAGWNARKAHWAVRLLGRDLALRLMSRFFGP